MDEAELRRLAEQLWDEAEYAADLDEGRLSASREWETRGDPLTREQAVDRLVQAVKQM